jgi:flagellar hook-length control protein FliK
MQTTSIPLLSTTATSQTKEATNLASNGADGPTFQKLLSNEIRKEIQKEQSTAKKNEVAQKNNLNKSNLPSNPSNSKALESEVSQELKLELKDSPNDEDILITDTSSAILSYVQDLSQFNTPPFTPINSASTASNVATEPLAVTKSEIVNDNHFANINSAASLSNNQKIAEQSNISAPALTHEASAKNLANKPYANNKTSLINDSQTQINSNASELLNNNNHAPELNKISKEVSNPIAMSAELKLDTAKSTSLPINLLTNPSNSSSNLQYIQPQLMQGISTPILSDSLKTFHPTISTKDATTQLTSLTNTPAPLFASQPKFPNEPTPFEIATQGSFKLVNLENHQEGIVNNSVNEALLENSNTSPQTLFTTSNLNPTDLRALPSAPVQAQITQSIRSNEWDQALGNKIIWMTQDGIQTAQLDLNPPDLGPLQIVLNISDAYIDASFVSSHLEVRNAVEASMPKLKEMMENTGLSLSGFNVSAENSSKQQFEQQKEALHRLNQMGENRRENTERSVITDITNTRSTPKSTLGQVDTFA